MSATKSFPVLVAALLAFSAFSAPAFAENAVAPEHNPPGDISDSQVFIDYAGSGFSMKVPEGWSRNDIAGGATFSDKYNLIDVTSTAAAVAPTVESAKKTEVAAIEAAARAAKIRDVSAVKLKGGPAIKIGYQSNSEPNAVTGKQIRLDRVRYLMFRAGKEVTLDMAAPAGADNVDQWLLMANSVTFK